MKKEELIHRLTSPKPVDQVVADIEKKAGEHQFRVLHVHDVQATLAEKGLQREPLKIVEVCNASFAHQALARDVDVAIFMPCRYSVYTEADQTNISLSRPTMIAQMLPESGLDELAASVEQTLKTIMEEAV
jgi:uncharacterized protein (DUF302 family)